MNAIAKNRKVKSGTVVSTGMDKTAVVAVVARVRHRKYGKIIKKTKHLYVHDAQNTLKVGDRVQVVESRPISRLKRWRLLKVVEGAR